MSNPTAQPTVVAARVSWLDAQPATEVGGTEDMVVASVMATPSASVTSFCMSLPESQRAVLSLLDAMRQTGCEWSNAVLDKINNTPR